MMQTDVIVVGGGPAGSATALALARLGKHVTLVEQARFPRRKVCGEYLNCGSVALIEELGLKNAVLAEAHIVKGTRLANKRREIVLAFPQTAASLARERLDAILLEAAVAAGVRVIIGRVTDVCFSAGRISGVAVQTESGESVLTARFVVGADGCGSVVARKAGLTQRVKSNPRFAVGGHYESGTGDWLEMSVADGSYLATNPLGGGKANVMLVLPQKRLAQSNGDRTRWAETTMRALELNDTICPKTTLIGKRVAIGPLYHRVARCNLPGLLLVGDAGGFISPFTGQGVFLALSSAKAAAHALSMSFDFPGRESALCNEYDRSTRNRLFARRLMTDAIDLLATFPVLAGRVMANIDASNRVKADLMRTFSSLDPPQNLLRFDILRTMLG